MKHRKLKPFALFALLAVSVVCLMTVNMSDVENLSKPSGSLSKLESAEFPLRDSKMPDLRLVKNVVNLIGNFLTAK